MRCGRSVADPPDDLWCAAQFSETGDWAERPDRAARHSAPFLSRISRPVLPEAHHASTLYESFK